MPLNVINQSTLPESIPFVFNYLTFKWTYQGGKARLDNRLNSNVENVSAHRTTTKTDYVMKIPI